MGQTPADWRKSFYYEYYEYPIPHHVRPHFGVVTDRCKLAHFYTPDINIRELFDLKTDPLELKDVAADPANARLVNDLEAEIGRLRAKLHVPDQPPPKAFGNRPLH